LREKERDVDVFYIRGREKKRKNRHVCCKKRDSSLCMRTFYRRFYPWRIKY